MSDKSGEEIKVGDLVQGLPRDGAHPIMGTVCGFEKVGPDRLLVVAYAALGTKVAKHAVISVGQEIVNILVHKAHMEQSEAKLVWRRE